MTHDELLAKLEIDWATVTIEQVGKAVIALRAVIELASTETINRAASGERFYDGFHYALKCVMEVVEKELE